MVFFGTTAVSASILVRGVITLTSRPHKEREKHPAQATKRGTLPKSTTRETPYFGPIRSPSALDTSRRYIDPETGSYNAFKWEPADLSDHEWRTLYHQGTPIRVECICHRRTPLESLDEWPYRDVKRNETSKRL